MDNAKSKRNIKPFDGEKYSVWKFRIRALLDEMDVLKVIDEDPVIGCQQWEKNNKIAKSVIVEYLTDSFLVFAIEETTARQIIQDLDALYERKSIANQLAIRKKLLALKLKGDTYLVKHFTIFDDLVTDLIAAGSKLEETDKIAHLFLTLPSTYDGVVTAIETLAEDNLTLAFVKTRLLDHEIKLKNESTDTSCKILHVENQSENFKKRKFDNSKYNNKNNYKDYKEIKNNYKNKSLKRTQNIKCFHCGRKGHAKKNCYYFQRMIQGHNAETNRARQVQAVSLIQNKESGFAFMAGVHEEIIKPNEITFILDSGASDHIVNREELFDNFVILNPVFLISVAKNGQFVSATKKGSMKVTSNMGVQGTLEDVLFCPEVPYNLMSVSKLQKAGYTIIFNKEDAQIYRHGKCIMKGMFSNNLIKLNFVVNEKSNIHVSQLYNANNKSYNLWHQRLGHISKSKFIELKTNHLIEDSEQIQFVIPSDSLCEACINGKQTRLPFNQIKDKTYIARPLYVVHSDVCGPITPPTFDNKNYYVLFVDQFTHYCVVYPITYKSDVFLVFKDYVAKSEAKFNIKLVYLYCDNGGEYLSTEMKDYCIKKGITYHLTVPRTPQQNGVSERMVRTITEKARSILNGAKMDKIFWGEAVLTAVHLINIAPTHALKHFQTPYELWHNKKPTLKYLKVFGSTVFVHNKTSKTKFDEKSWKGILVGYQPNGYKVWNVETGKIVIVRDVIVDETNFLQSRPVLKSEENKTITNSHDETDSHAKSKSVSTKFQCNNETDNDEKSKSVSIKVGCHEKPDDNEIACKTRKIDKVIVETPNETNINSDNFVLHKNNELRRSDRLKGHPRISYYEGDDDYVMCAMSVLSNNPMSYEEIKTRDDRVQWEAAIKDELNSFQVNNTWTLVPRPGNKNIVDCKWIFSIKHDEYGNPLRYKARLVARGFRQEYPSDYSETFAPVARMDSFRFMIAFANQHQLLIHYMDVKTAFLNGKLKEEIYMEVPKGVENKNNNYVCKLNKSLYGLKQAARCWFEVFEESLKGKGFKNSLVDRCIYMLDRGNISKNIYVILYVDDLVIVCANLETMNNFKKYLMSKFDMRDLKEIKMFLGIKVMRYDDKITLDQSSYIKTVLNKYNMQDCNPVNTPIESKINFEALNSEEKYNAPCRNVIGCLMYIMLCTRPDLSICVNILSRYTNKNNKELWQCLKRVMRYLKGTVDLKLTYKQCNYNNILSGYVDSDWGGGDASDRKSTTGYLFKLYDKCTITWNTKRQTSVAASSTEAEYMALYEAVREALWLKSLAASVNVCVVSPITIYEDNNSCINIANNPTNHKRTKHIDIKYHFSREQIEKNIVRLCYIPTGEQLADAFTKPLPAAAFNFTRNEMGLE